MKRPILIFDLGGVLINIRYDRFFETLSLDHIARPGLGMSLGLAEEAALLGLSTLDLQLYETGKISTNEFFVRLRMQLSGSYRDHELHEAWYAILAGEIEGMRSVIGQLSDQGPLYLLSNTNELHFAYAQKTFPILSFFKQHFVSYRIGAMKPSHEIYRFVVHSLKVQPGELFFIDDLHHNIDGAKEVGLRGHVFHGIEDLPKVIRDLGYELS